MTIIVEIKPEVQEALNRQAAAHGVDMGAYAASLLEEAVQPSADAKAPSASQLDDALRRLSQFSHKIPVLPNDAFSRENLYQDRD